MKLTLLVLVALVGAVAVEGFKLNKRVLRSPEEEENLTEEPRTIGQLADSVIPPILQPDVYPAPGYGYGYGPGVGVGVGGVGLVGGVGVGVNPYLLGGYSAGYPVRPGYYGNPYNVYNPYRPGYF